MLFDPKNTRQQQVERALEEARKVLTEYEHHNANTNSSMNLIEQQNHVLKSSSD